MEAFDKDGNKIEGVFTQEDLDAKIEAEKEAAQTALAEAVTKAQEEAINKYKEENPPVVEKKGEEGGEKKKDDDNEPPAWFKPFAYQVQALSGNQQSQHIKKVTSVLDADKRKEVQEKFDSLQGYDTTTEGLESRAHDAYLLVMGEKPDSGAVNVANLNVAGTGRVPLITGKESSSTDKEVQKALGISDADVEKYGNKEDK